MSHFVLQSRKKDGNEYPPNTASHLLWNQVTPQTNWSTKSGYMYSNICIHWYQKNTKLWDEKNAVNGCRYTVSPGWATHCWVKDLLWKTGQLGDRSPQALVDTIFFMCGVYCALQSGHEHRALRLYPCQIELLQSAGKRTCFLYIEDISRNNPGGLRGRTNKPKTVTHYENSDNSHRCVVHLFKLQMPSRQTWGCILPQTTEKYNRYICTCWHSCQPIGHCTLAGTVAQLMYVLYRKKRQERKKPKKKLLHTVSMIYVYCACVYIRPISFYHSIQIGETKVSSTRLALAKWANDPYKMMLRTLANPYIHILP